VQIQTIKNMAGDKIEYNADLLAYQDFASLHRLIFFSLNNYLITCLVNKKKAL